MCIDIIIRFEDATDEVKQFLKKEWVSANVTQFGRDISDEINKPLTIMAYDESSPPQLVGVGRCLIVGKTIRLSHLLVKENFRQKFPQERPLRGSAQPTLVACFVEALFQQYCPGRYRRVGLCCDRPSQANHI